MDEEASLALESVVLLQERSRAVRYGDELAKASGAALDEVAHRLVAFRRRAATSNTPMETDAELRERVARAVAINRSVERMARVSYIIDGQKTLVGSAVVSHQLRGSTLSVAVRATELKEVDTIAFTTRIG